ncbi:MAG: PrsW family glutamic-type intramembrane protease [Patescibacteria group bacterium]
MTSDPKIIGMAFLGGIIPSLLWLWFWLREDREHPEPKGLLAVIFIVGMIAVIFVLPVQKFIQAHIISHEGQLILWASAEEIIKYLAVLIVLYRTSYINQPIDWPMYIITAALGFAALENSRFLIQPLQMGQDTVGLLTGQLRFLGSTLLHTVSSGILGILLGISLRMNPIKRTFYLLGGFALAIALHSLFNFFIIRNGGDDFLRVFGFLWVATIIMMLLFERVRRMN